MNMPGNWKPSSKPYLASIAVATLAIGVTGVTLAAEPTSTDREFIEMQTSINAMMVAMVDWSAHELWEMAYADSIDDRNWLTVKQYAIELLASGTLVSLGGTGRADRAWAADELWQEWTASMIEESKEAIRAIDARDQDRLRASGEKLLEICEGCHADFKPNLPTEGIMHVPHHDYGDPLARD